MEMDNSLQQSMFNQLQQMQQQMSSVQQQQAMTYNMFQQSMNQAQWNQASALGSISNIPGMAASFAGSQMGGLQSGFGIPQGTGSFVNNYIARPVGSAFNQTAGLTTSYLSAALTSRPVDMTAEQRQDLANALANGVGGLSTSVLGGVGKVGGAVGGYMGSAAVGAAIGWGPAFLLGAGMYGAGKIATSQTLASLTGGLIGGANENIFHPMRHFQEELKENRELTSLFENNSYSFLSVNAKRNNLTGNLTMRDSQDWANKIRKWDTKFNMTDADAQGIMKASIDNGLVSNIRDFDEFEDKMSKQIKYVKNASKILNKTFGQITDMMADFKRAGVGLENFDMKAAELKTYAMLFGKTIDATKDFLLSVSSSMTQGTTVGTGTVMTQTATSGINMKNALDNAKRSGNTDFVNLVNNVGGPEQAGAVVLQGFNKALGPTSIGGHILMNAVDFNAQTGKFSINNTRLSELSSGVLAGKYDYQSLSTMGSSHINQWDNATKAALYNQMPSLIQSSSYATKDQALNLIINSIRNNPAGAGMDNSTIMSSFMGIDYNTGLLMQGALDNFNKNGVNLLMKQAMTPFALESYATRENYLAAKKRGWWNGTTGFLDDLATSFAVKPVQSMQNSLQGIMNRRAGMPSETLANYQLSGASYNFTDMGIASTSANINYNLLSHTQNLATYMGKLGYSPEGIMSPGSRYAYEFTPGGGLRRDKGMDTSLYLKSSDYMKMLVGGGGYNISKFHSVTKVNDLRSDTMDVDADTKARYESLGLGNMFAEASSTTGVNSSILKAIGLIESHFTPTAGSNKGAQGIMQIMPYNLDGANGHDPYQNIMQGSKIYKGMLERFKGNIFLAAGGYNGGGGTIDKALKAAFGFSSQTASREQLLNVNIDELLPYIGKDETRDYIGKFAAALGKMGYNTDSATNTAVREQDVAEWSVNSAFLDNGKFFGDNVTKSGLYGVLKDSQGWSTRRTTEYTHNKSINADAVSKLSEQLGKASGSLYNSGNKAAAAALYRSSSFMQSMKTMSPNSLSDQVLQNEMNSLSSTLTEFKGQLSKDIVGTIQGTIKTLKGHMSTKNTFYDTFLDNGISQSVQAAGLMFTKDLAIQPGMNKTDFDKMSGLGYSVFSTLKGIAGKAVGDISVADIAGNAKSIAEMSAIAGKQAGETGQLLVSDVTTAKSALTKIIGAKVSDITQNVLQQPAASVKGSVSYDSYNSSISRMNSLKHDFSAAMSKGDADAALSKQKELEEAAGLAHAQKSRLETDSMNQIKKSLQGVNLESALRYTSTKYNKLMMKGGAESSQLQALQQEREALLLMQEMQSGNFDALNNQSSESAMRFMNALATKGSYNLGTGVAQGVTNNVRTIYRARNAENKAFGVPSEDLLAQGKSTTKADTVRANLPSLVVGGEYTDSYNAFINRIENGTLTASGLNKILQGVKYGGKESALYQGLYDSYMQYGSGTDVTVSGGRGGSRVVKHSAVRDNMDKLGPASNYENNGEIGLYFTDLAKSYGYKDSDIEKFSVDYARKASKFIQQGRTEDQVFDNKKRNMYMRGLSGPLQDQFVGLLAGGDLDAIQGFVQNNINNLSSAQAKSIAQNYYLGDGPKKSFKAYTSREDLRKSAELEIKGTITEQEILTSAKFDTAKITSDAGALLLGATEGLTITAANKGKKGRGAMHNAEEAYVRMQHDLDRAGSMTLAEYQATSKKNLDNLIESTSNDSGVSKIAVTKHIADTIKKSVDEKIAKATEALAQTKDGSAEQKALKKTIEGLQGVDTALEKAAKGGADSAEMLSLATTKLAELNGNFDKQFKDYVDNAQTQTDKYIKATDKYYDMVQDRLTDLQRRIEILRSQNIRF